MSEENSNTSPLTTMEIALDAMKTRADTIGVKYHPNIGLDKLQEKIDEKVADNLSNPTESKTSPAPSAPAPVVAKPVAETEGQKRFRLKQEATALVRIRVTCMNPNKTEWEGEVFTTGNKLVGTIKKYVHFGEPWHVPRMILNMIQERKCQVFKTVKRGDKKVKEGQLVAEFAIEILPKLTERELHDLAQRQAMANGTSDA